MPYTKQSIGKVTNYRDSDEKTYFDLCEKENLIIIPNLAGTNDSINNLGNPINFTQ